MRRMSIWSMTFEITSRQSSMIASWNTIPTSVCGRSTTLPPTVIVPEVYGTRPATILRMVVLPQPLGPTIATNSDCRMSRLTSTQASTAPPLVSYTLATFWRRM